MIAVSTKKPLLFYVPFITQNYTHDACLDTGAFHSAMSFKTLQKIKQLSPDNIVSIKQEQQKFVSVANKSPVKILSTAVIKFTLSNIEYIEPFLIAPNLTNTLIGLPFFEKNNILIDAKHRILITQDLSLHLNMIQNKAGGKQHCRTTKKPFALYTVKKLTIPPDCQELIQCDLTDHPEMRNKTGVVEPAIKFEGKTGLCITSSLSRIDENGLTTIAAINVQPYMITIPAKTIVATFKLLTPEQAEHLVPLEPALLQSEDLQNNLQNLIEIKNKTDASKPKHAEKLWFPTPETCKDPSRLNKIERRIYDSLCDFKLKQELDPKRSEQERLEFLTKFNWSQSIFSENEKHKMENLLVEFHDIFARHRFDVGLNTTFKAKLTPENNMPIYAPNPQTPVHLREDLLVELALMQYFDIVTTLPYSKYSSPIFAKRKPNGKLRILIDLRKINFLLRHDYSNNNFPVATMTDAGQHLANKNIFAKLDCSQAYFSIGMADELSVQLLAFNFGSRTWAFKRLAQGLSRSPTIFSSCIRHHLERCIATDKCYSFFDDIGAGANSGEELIKNLREIFKCVRNAGLRLSMDKCQFGVKTIDFLGHTINQQGSTPNKEKVNNFLKKLKMPKTLKQIRRLIGFVQFFKSYIPNLTNQLRPFYSLLRNDNAIIITHEHEKALEEITFSLKKACERTLRIAQKDLQYIILADASHYAAGYVLLIEDYCENQAGKKIKNYAPVSFGSRLFTPNQLKLSMYCKEFLATVYALETFEANIWGATKYPIILLTDNKSLTRFFQSKTLPPSLWSKAEYFMSFNLILGHIPGRANAAADYLSRMYVNPDTKFKLQLKDRLPIHDVEIEITPKQPDNTLSSIKNANLEHNEEKQCIEEQLKPEVFIITLAHLLTDENILTEAIKFTTKEKRTLNALYLNNPLDSPDLSEKYSTLNMQEEQRKDKDITETLTWLRRKRTPISKYLNFDLQKYRKQFKRLTVNNNVLYRQYFNHIGNISHLQLCVPKHLRTELIYRLHNSKQKGHQGISNTLVELRKGFYFPGYQESIRDYISNCTTCHQAKNAKLTSQRPPLQPVSALQFYPEDMMQVDIVGKLPECKGYKYILSAMDVFSKYLFAIPIKHPDASTVARHLTDLFLQHSYIPRSILCDKGSVFTSNLIKELAQMLEIKIENASVKHAQTIGLLERAHGPLKKYLRIYEKLNSRQWPQLATPAAYAHNTRYHASIGSTPSFTEESHLVP